MSKTNGNTVNAAANFPDRDLRWSSANITALNRPAKYELAASRLLDPVRTTWPSADSMRASIECVDLAQIAVMRLKGSAHRVHHGHGEIRSSSDRVFHLSLNKVSDWMLADSAGTRRVPAGDAVLIDSGFPYEMEVQEYDIINIRVSTTWISTWISTPQRLVGNTIPHDRMWGASLTALVAALEPSQIGRWPLTPSIVADQIGAQLCIADHLRRSSTA